MTQKIVNGILFGSTGVGKTNLIRMLEDPTQAIESFSEYNTTEHPSSHVVSIDWEPHSTSYQLKVIDTPALQQIRCLSDAQRNVHIIDEIRQFLIDEKITHLSFIGFVFNINQISSKEIKALKQLRQFLGETLSNRTFLIFTHCKEKIISDYIDEMCRPLISYAQLGRIYTGLLHSNSDKVNNMSSHRADIFKMRNIFFEQVFNNCTSIPIPSSWFDRVSYDLSEQYNVLPSEPPQSQTGCCAKYFKWCKCQHCVDYYFLMAFFLFSALILSLLKYLWVFVSSSVRYISNQFRGLSIEKPRKTKTETNMND